jgi:hypothetical protein
VLEVGGSVDLLVDNRVLIIDGTVNLAGRSAMHATGNGIITVNGAIVMNNQSLLKLANGWLDNRGTVSSQGRIENGIGSGTTTTPGIFNAGIVRLFDGGVLENSGEFIGLSPEDFNENAESLVVDRQGKFINLSGGRVSPRRAAIHGEFINEKGAELRSRRNLYIGREGRLENRGYIRLWSAAGRLNVLRGGSLDSTSGSYISNEGATIYVNGMLRLTSATLHNIDNGSSFGAGTINIGGAGTLHASGFSYVVSDAGATIDNMGSVLFECFAIFKNNGTLLGNAVGRSLCFDPDFIVLPVINWPW